MAFDYFLRIDGVAGESADAKHKGEIEVESWSWGEANAGPHLGGGGGGGRVEMQDFHFVAPVSKASPTLLLACATGHHYKSAVLTCRQVGKAQQEFLTFTFSDVLVSSFAIGGTAASEVAPIDQVSLNFSKIQVEYKEQKADGSLGTSTKVGWDVKTHKSF
jgi:type VI secretion system secreted protein Hcp